MFKYTEQIDSSELEKTYNHLHHAKIFCLLERARLEFLVDLGIPQETLIEQDCLLVLSRCDVQFLRELKDEEVIATVEVLERKGDSGFVLKQELYKKPRRIAVRADIELVAMSSKTRRRRALPQELEERLL